MKDLRSAAQSALRPLLPWLKDLKRIKRTAYAPVAKPPEAEGSRHIVPLIPLTESGVKEGFCLVNAMHITASVFINDNESGLHSDYERWLEKLAPEKPHDQYAHNGFEDNADAHLKRTIMGREVVVAITD